ncbi:hypothetical protein BIFDEN_02413 [Bifidobacterium dentium ATCC 27678]|nr:hypothetical protein BIFDEN_02413 [Bifidobacterium dentium ATCC 27678]
MTIFFLLMRRLIVGSVRRGVNAWREDGYVVDDRSSQCYIVLYQLE